MFLEVYSFEGMGSRVHGRFWHVVGDANRGCAGGREGGSELASPLRPVARPAACGLRGIFKAREHERTADSASWAALSRALCVRSAARGNPAYRWRQNRPGPLVQ